MPYNIILYFKTIYFKILPKLQQMNTIQTSGPTGNLCLIFQSLSVPIGSCTTIAFEVSSRPPNGLLGCFHPLIEKASSWIHEERANFFRGHLTAIRKLLHGYKAFLFPQFRKHKKLNKAHEAWKFMRHAIHPLFCYLIK